MLANIIDIIFADFCKQNLWVIVQEIHISIKRIATVQIYYSSYAHKALVKRLQ